MKRTFFTFLLLLFAPFAATTSSAQPDDVLLGNITIRNPDKLDANSRKKISEIAATVKKKRLTGVIKIRGDFSGAENASEYLSRSVFMAREVENYLRSLLPPKYQLYVTGSRYSGARSGESSVEILLYPHQLRPEELEALKALSSKPEPLPLTPKSDVAIEKALPSESVTEGGLLSQPDDDADSRGISRKEERETEHHEDAALANELVQKAKARAAEKARRRESGD